MNTYLASLIVIISLLPVSLTCEIRSELSGTISDSVSARLSKCWVIDVPSMSYTKLTIKEFTPSVSCFYAKLEISIPGNGQSYTVCPNQPKGRIIDCFNDVNITFTSNYLRKMEFTIDYITESMACLGINHFRCSKHICIPEEKVCDGVKDCENGADEQGCGTGVGSVKGVNISRENSIKWLNSKRTDPSGWGLNTHRAVVALYLANETYFNTREPEKELIVKQLELLTTLTLVNDETNKISVNELSMFINALLVTCHDPTDFYGSNLVQKLSDRLSPKSPTGYLALCNTKGTIPEDSVKSLFGELPSKLLPPYSLDAEAMTVMAITCMKNRANGFDKLGVDDAEKTYNEAVKRMIDSQLSDGSFGNQYTTALVTQALLSAAQENNKSWKLRPTIQYLMNKFNSPSVDLFLTYSTLPVLNSKSLANIATVKCPAIRKSDFQVVSNFIDNKEGKMNVHDSFHNGDYNAKIPSDNFKALGRFIYGTTSSNKVTA